MKYGESLGAHSVPEWQSHNILYDELKHEIKDLTASPSAFTKADYNALLDAFRDEYSGVNLFVSCKISEIEYRFQQCDHMIRALAATPGDDRDLKREISKLTQDIQNLSRFIGAQFTGFRKLIKKYRRHAPPEQLRKGRDLEEVSDLLLSKDSFAEVDLTPQFLELSVLYSALRTHQFNEYVKKPVKGTSLVDKLIDFDVEMVTAPVSDVHRFWVHPDNLMQVKLRLLQHMDLLAPPELQAELSQRLDPSLHAGLGGTGHSPGHGPGHAPAYFAEMPEERTKAMYMDTEELQSARNLKEPAQIRQISVGDQRSNPFFLAPMGGNRHPAVMALHESQVADIKNRRYDEFRESLSPPRDLGAQLALAWATSHKVEPIVSLITNCTRFRSSTGDKVWAFLDSDTTITDSPVNFPYSVLEIRTRTQTAWVDALRDSSLVYPVSASFSLYAWALLTTRPQQVLIRPSWLDVLESGGDIRRDPAVYGSELPMKRKSVANLKLLGGRSGRREEETANEERPPPRRYWNEFDDGDEFQDSTEHFFDEIDAELQRAKVAARLAQPVYKIGEGMRRQFHTWFDGRRGSSDLETGLSPSSASVRSISSQSTLDHREESGRYSPRLSSRPSSSQNYGSCDNPAKHDVYHSDPGLTFYISLLFLSSSVIVGLVFYVLCTEDLSLLSTGFRAFLVLALSLALFLALSGYVIFNFRSGSDWMSQVAVNVALLTIVCFGVGGATNIAIPSV